MEVRPARDALIDSVSPYAVINNREVLRQIGPRESINTLRVYIAICGHVNRRTGLANPSQARLAGLLGITRKTVNRSIARLIKRGLLRIDHKRPAPGGKGTLLFLMPVFTDASMTAIEAQSIASYPQTLGHLTVPQVNHSPLGHSTVPSKRARDTNNRINRSPYGTPNSPDASGTPILSPELLEHKTLMDTSLKTAEAVIEHWRACAWMHGEENPVANDDDLATAHALTARGITADELEAAVLQAPESPRLAPLVRSLLA